MKQQISILLHIFLLLALSACGVTNPSLSPMPSPTVTPMPSGKVDVGGYSLYYECSGQGSLTVILESGGTGDSSDWLAVIDGLENTTRVCAYDGTSLSRSDPVIRPRTFEEMTRDLQVLLSLPRKVFVRDGSSARKTGKPPFLDKGFGVAITLRNVVQ